jgi:hypothetical protein
MPYAAFDISFFAFDFFRRHCRFDYFHIAPRRAIFDADAFISLMPLFSQILPPPPLFSLC